MVTTGLKSMTAPYSIFHYLYNSVTHIIWVKSTFQTHLPLYHHKYYIFLLKLNYLLLWKHTPVSPAAYICLQNAFYISILHLMRSYPFFNVQLKVVPLPWNHAWFIQIEVVSDFSISLCLLSSFFTLLCISMIYILALPECKFVKGMK